MKAARKPPPPRPNHVATPVTIQVEKRDPTVVRYLYGPDGEPIATVTERPIIEFGFHPREEDEL